MALIIHTLYLDLGFLNKLKTFGEIGDNVCFWDVQHGNGLVDKVTGEGVFDSTCHI